MSNKSTKTETPVIDEVVVEETTAAPENSGSWNIRIPKPKFRKPSVKSIAIAASSALVGAGLALAAKAYGSDEEIDVPRPELEDDYVPSPRLIAMNEVDA